MACALLVHGACARLRRHARRPIREVAGQELPRSAILTGNESRTSTCASASSLTVPHGREHREPDPHCRSAAMAEAIDAIVTQQPGSKTYRVMTAVAYYAGLRPSEVVMLCRSARQPDASPPHSPRGSSHVEGGTERTAFSLHFGP